MRIIISKSCYEDSTALTSKIDEEDIKKGSYRPISLMNVTLLGQHEHPECRNTQTRRHVTTKCGLSLDHKYIFTFQHNFNIIYPISTIKKKTFDKIQCLFTIQNCQQPLRNRKEPPWSTEKHLKNPTGNVIPVSYETLAHLRSGARQTYPLLPTLLYMRWQCWASEWDKDCFRDNPK